MCNIPSPNTRALIIEVLENGKVSLPPFIHAPDQQLTLDELKKCRDYIDLIIANPDNFHVVKPDILPGLKKIEIGLSYAFCSECNCDLLTKSMTERENGLCFQCEKNQILKEADSYKPVKCMICEGEFKNDFQRQAGICGKCAGVKPGIVVKSKADK